MKYHPDFIRLADAMFPTIDDTIEQLESRYPKRTLKPGAEVTRFAPSPTGFLHTGSLFTSLIAKKIARQSGGIFFLRLEDTDSKREIEGSDRALITQMQAFGVAPDEGFGVDETGRYGPYRQSQRASIYQTVIKELVKRGDAYPCFATPEELDELRKYQESRKLVTGVYGSFAKYRDYPVDEAIADIISGRPFVVRFKSSGSTTGYITVKDEIRGEKQHSQNYSDIVILKSDGLPTYHFAHVVDDHFMRTTVVIRGEEWWSSFPIHVEMFERIGWELPRFAHLPVIMKLDEGKKRKLSKRHDSEAAVSFFLEHGYPIDAFIEYLMIIANSNFEEWRIANPDLPIDDFHLSFDKMSNDGALFDMQKVIYLSKERIAKMSADELMTRSLEYAKNYHPRLLELIERDPHYYRTIINIEREKENPRKDYYSYESIYDLIRYFYRDQFEAMFDPAVFNPSIPLEKIVGLLEAIKLELVIHEEESVWFAQLKDIAERFSFAPSNKIFKQNRDRYVGHIGDAAEILRISITSLKQTPNLHQILLAIKREEMHWRLQFVIDKLSRK